jgi:hypothetical protein
VDTKVIARFGLALITRATVPCVLEELNAALAVREMLSAIAQGKYVLIEAEELKTLQNEKESTNVAG